MTFQKTISTHRFTLFAAIFAGFVIWLADRQLDSMSLLGVIPAALAVYFTAELNNAFGLLRISSRMISTLLALLLPMATFLHPLQPAHAVLLFSVAVGFPLYACYKRPNRAVMPFLAFLLLGCTALFVPQLLLLTPALWVSVVMMRAASLRSWVASLLGLAMPYWFAFTYYYVTDSLPAFADRWAQVIDLQVPDYSGLTLAHWLVLGLLLVLFGIGCVDFAQSVEQDVPRTRMIYKVEIVLGSISIVALLLQPQLFHELLPLCILPTVILSGHFVALSYGRIQNYITIGLLVAVLAISAINALGIFS